MGNLPKPTTQEEIAHASNSVLGEIDQTLAMFAWETGIKKDIKWPEDIKEAKTAIHNALVQSVMLTIRTLDSFFGNHKKKPNDFISADLDFLRGKVSSFLDEEERKKVNKHVAHMTYDTLANPEPPLPYRKMLERMMPQAVSAASEIKRWAESNNETQLATHAEQCLFCLDWANTAYVSPQES